MPGRHYKGIIKHRYGFNGKENDTDLNVGDLDFGARIYDSKLARWLSIDRKDNIGWSPYNFAVNNPIKYIDKDGNIQRDAQV